MGNKYADLGLVANPAAGEFEIDLDRRRILKLTIGAAAKFAAVTGMSIQEFMMEVSRASGRKATPREDHVAALLWCMLIHREPMLTVEQAAERIDAVEAKSDFEKVAYVIGKCTEVWCAKQGIDFSRIQEEAEEKAKEDGGPARPPETRTPSQPS